MSTAEQRPRSARGTTLFLAPDADVGAVRRALVSLGQWVREGTAVGGARVLTIELGAAIDPETLRTIGGVVDVAVPPSPHPRLDAMPRSVRVGSVSIGADHSPVLIAGPCAVESEAQIAAAARLVAASGARLLRGGAFKPRTSPYSFQGHGETALKWLSQAARTEGLYVVTECLAPEDADVVAEYADLVQIGTRNMQNFRLLEAVGRTGRPVLLKRGRSAPLEEWLLAGEYLLAHGASGVVFCERGLRHFDPNTRNLLDLGAVAVLAADHGLPVVVDPSHGTGRRDLVAPLSRAALAAGAAGLMLEVHPDPATARSDGPQALLPEDFARLASELTGRAASARRALGGAA